MDYYRQIGREEIDWEGRKGRMRIGEEEEKEKNRPEEKERTEEIRIGNDCLGRGEEDRKGRRTEERRV